MVVATANGLQILRISKSPKPEMYLHKIEDYSAMNSNSSLLGLEDKHMSWMPIQNSLTIVSFQAKLS